MKVSYVIYLRAFNEPVLCIRKPYGLIQILIDYWKIIKNIALHSFTLPNIDDILYSLSGATVFSTFDRNAFYQVPLDEESKQFTPFSVGDHKY